MYLYREGEEFSGNLQNREHFQTIQSYIKTQNIIIVELCIIVQYHENNKALIFNYDILQNNLYKILNYNEPLSDVSMH